MKVIHQKCIFEKKMDLIWHDLNKCRHEFAQILENEIQKKEIIDNMVMILSEMLENVCKYSLNAKFYMHMETIQTDKNLYLIIRQENPIPITHNNTIKTLQKEIEHVNSHENPQFIYLENLKRASERTDNRSQIGLSLIRLLAGGAKIELYNSKHYTNGILIRIVTKLEND